MTSAELRAQAASGVPLSPAAMEIVARDLERLEAIDAQRLGALGRSRAPGARLGRFDSLVARMTQRLITP